MNLRHSNPPQYVTSYLGQGSAGMAHGSFDLWINMWVTSKTV